jgi:glucose/arabinose dehydrogenase
VTLRRRAALASLALVTACTSGTAAVRPTATATPTPSPSATTGPGKGLTLDKLGTFSNPVWVGTAPGDPLHLYVAEKTGRVMQIAPDGTVIAVVLDLSKLTSHGNEQGLLSIAFDPGFATNHRFYVDYTDKTGTTQVVAYEMVDGTPRNREVLLSVPQPFENHNGGLLLFDPSGKLLVATGDGGSAGDPDNRAQDLTDNLGKLLRIEPRTEHGVVAGAGVADNPFPKNKRIWAVGLRNPWRFSFDTNGDLYLGDNGQNQIEELDVVPPAYQRGANYGWSVYEGNLRYKKDVGFSTTGPVIAPAYTYLHTEGGCSITGGVVYRGHVIPALVGTYVFGDYCAGRLLIAKRTSGGVTEPERLGLKVDGLQAFGVDLDGELLVMSSDTLYRLTLA